MTLELLKSINLLARFLLELSVLLAVALWGFSVSSAAGKIGLGVGGPLIIAVAWGMFAAPKSSMRLQEPYLFGFVVVVFGIGAMALLATHHIWILATFCFIAILNTVLLYLWRQ